MFDNYYFVASTLPIKYIVENNNNKKTLIIIKNKNIYEAYKYIVKFKNNIKLHLLSDILLFRVLYLLNLIFICKIKKKKFYFFHECCWPDLDLIINILNPKCYFVPIVTMNGFTKIRKINFYRYKFKIKFKLFIYFFFKKLFNIYFRETNNSFHLYLSFKRYPKNVKKIFILFKFKKNVPNKILLLVGKEFCDDKEIILIYKKIIHLLKKKFNIFYKDHPNVSARLNYNFKNINKIKPNIPFELLNLKFKYIIGCGSTPLSYFGDKSYSVLKLLKSYNSKQFIKRVAHIKSIYKGKEVNFLNSIEDIKRIQI
jgi:hypothetical protein